MNTENQQKPQFTQARAAEAERAKTSRVAGPLILILCLVVALAAVLFVPLFVGGASSASSEAATVSVSQPEVGQNCSDMAQATQALGFEPVVPTEVPKGYGLTAIRTLEGGVLELEYTAGHSVVLYRTAPGSDDLSADHTEYAYTVTEETDLARSYAGTNQKKWNLAVWAGSEYSFAILAENGLGADEMRTMAESIG